MKLTSLVKSLSRSPKASAETSDKESTVSEPLRVRVAFNLKHLGSMPVDDETHGKRYKDGVGASAVRTIVVMAKSSRKKGVDCQVDLSSKSIRVQESDSHKMLVEAPMHRVCFCTCDGVYNKVFAFIYRVPDRETMECHAFYCGSTKLAQLVARTMFGGFIAAQEQLREDEKLRVHIPVYPISHTNRSNSERCRSRVSSDRSSVDSGASGTGSGSRNSEGACSSTSNNELELTHMSADRVILQVAQQLARVQLGRRASNDSGESDGVASITSTDDIASSSSGVSSPSRVSPQQCAIVSESAPATKVWASCGDVLLHQYSTST